MRPVTEAIYGIPAERVIGSAVGLRFSEDEAAAEGWTVVSVKNDWITVFAEPSPGSR